MTRSPAIDRRRRALAFAALAGLAGTPLLPRTARAATAGGVDFAEQIKLGPHALVLNGAGIRYKTVFKVYAAGLYLTQKSSSAEDVLAAPQAKRMHMVLLRDIDADDIGKLFVRGLQENMPKGVSAQLVPSILRVSQVFSEYRRLHEGDTIISDWVPGTGTVVTVRGQSTGAPIPEPAFYRAFLSIWLGAKPADWTLKDQLLGKSPNAAA
ncbi:MAG: chalcone isomerase family protein [Ottowia sp.]|uniref:chalcone isomerase family protein n=1 Tax=Ottowia sp. TaxID=1898956 RepID=UPI0039E261A8